MNHNDNTNVLVIGFSVTEEKDGYVEYAREQHSTQGSLTLSKVGIGGIHPHQLKYLLPSILRQYRPDGVILEIATSSFRKRPEAETRHADDLVAMLTSCARAGVFVGLLDLPRTDIDLASDWAFGTHERISKSMNIDRVAVCECNSDTVKDVVHPTPTGKRIYSNALTKLLGVLLSNRAVPSVSASPTTFDSILLAELRHPQLELNEFKRGGFETTFCKLPESLKVQFRLPTETTIVGLIHMMGPRTGKLQVEMDGQVSELRMYDEYCYYNRVSVSDLPPTRTRDVSMKQLQGVPNIELRKGTKSEEARLALISHFLVERSE